MSERCPRLEPDQPSPARKVVFWRDSKFVEPALASGQPSKQKFSSTVWHSHAHLWSTRAAAPRHKWSSEFSFLRTLVASESHLVATRGAERQQTHRHIDFVIAQTRAGRGLHALPRDLPIPTATPACLLQSCRFLQLSTCAATEAYLDFDLIARIFAWGFVLVQFEFLNHDQLVWLWRCQVGVQLKSRLVLGCTRRTNCDLRPLWSRTPGPACCQSVFKDCPANAWSQLYRDLAGFSPS